MYPTTNELLNALNIIQVESETEKPVVRECERCRMCLGCIFRGREASSSDTENPFRTRRKSYGSHIKLVMALQSGYSKVWFPLLQGCIMSPNMTLSLRMCITSMRLSDNIQNKCGRRVSQKQTEALVGTETGQS